MEQANGQVAEATTVLTYDQVFSLAGKFALSTGGGSGIGFDITRCIAVSRWRQLN